MKATRIFSYCIITLLMLSPVWTCAADLEEKLGYLKSHEELEEGYVVFCTGSLCKLYEERKFKVIWENKANIDGLIHAIDFIYYEGLHPTDYHIISIKKLYYKGKNRTEDEQHDLEILLTDALLLLYAHLSEGKIDPISLDPIWDFPQDKPGAFEVLDKLVNDTHIEDALYELLPHHEIYHSLESALRKYIALRRNGGWDSIPGLDEQHDSLYYKLRKRLMKTGDLPFFAADDILTNDILLEHGIRHFQKRHGLKPSGVLTDETINAMNVPAWQRVLQIEANMERWRWLPKDMSEHVILVNIPAFELQYFKERKLASTNRIIVGRDVRKTPVFHDTLEHIIINPTWTIPPTILKEDILPKLAGDVSYLNKIGIEVKKGSTVINPALQSWNESNIGNYAFVQPAGDDNPLGRIKIMFPNEHLIYLHDTPGRHKFDATERTFSSGCIRVEYPFLLAANILEYTLGDSGYPVSLFDLLQIKNSNKTGEIKIDNAPEIMILYWTAWQDELKQTHFRRDVYERDVKLLEMLAETKPDI